jgi:hypothetical protein
VASFIGRNNVLRGKLSRLEPHAASVQLGTAEFSARIPEWLRADWKVGSTVNYVLAAYRIRPGEGCVNSVVGELRGIISINGRLRAEFDTGPFGILRADFDSNIATDTITPSGSLCWNTEDAYILPGQRP